MSAPTVGIFHGIPYAEYAAWGCVRASTLKALDRSPAHYQQAVRYGSPQTKATSLGTAAHCAALEPARFLTDFIAWDARTDSGRAAPRNGKAWDAFQATHAGKTIITEAEMRQAVAISRAVRAAPAARQYLTDGEPEVSMAWQHDGHTIQARPDWLTYAGGRDVLVGLKTTRDVRERSFGRQAVAIGYPLAWALYHDGFRALTGRSPRLVEIVVEATAPHSVTVYGITDAIIAQGREDYERLLAILSDCQATGKWPGPQDAEVDLQLPPWAFGDAVDDIIISDAEEA